MSKKLNNGLVVALDIGTSKIAMLIAEPTSQGELEVVGVGHRVSRGLKRGVVVNIEATIQSIREAVQDAEAMAGCRVQSVYTGIAGSHIRGFNSHGIVAIRDREVTQKDVDRVIEAAKAVAIPADQHILHILPQEFIIDGQAGVREPVGMSGVRLEAKVHLVTGGLSAVQNITKCVRHCGLQVSDIVLEQLASSHAVLSPDEKELGICLVDIGAGTTDIAIYAQDAIRHTAVIPVGGDHVTGDMVVALRSPIQQAEVIKLESGLILSPEADIDPSLRVVVPAVGRRRASDVSPKRLSDVIQARYQEILELVRSEINQSGFEPLVCGGVVITGGGSQMPGLLSLAERTLDMPIRLGVPQGVQGLLEVCGNPAYATGVGLLLHGHQSQCSGMHGLNLPDGNPKKVWSRMRDWFQANF